MGGLTHRDQMVGPWQVPVADVAVTLADYRGFKGEAMAMGERTPLAYINAPASGRMAVAEAITNMLAAPNRAVQGQVVGQLDGRLRRARRRRGALRHRQGRGHGAVPAAGHLYPRGQGQPVHAPPSGTRAARSRR